MKLYIFDLDETLIKGFYPDREGDPFLPYDDVTVLPGRLEKIRTLADHGSLFSIVTNQGGVAFGQQTVEQVHRKLGMSVVALEFFYSQPVSVHYCLHHPHATVDEWRQDPCERRKPSPRMLHEAIDAHNWLITEALFVGDLPTDEQAAAAADVSYMDAREFFA